MMPSDVPGLNLYFVVTMEPVEGKPQTINCGLEIQVSCDEKYSRIKTGRYLSLGLCQHQRGAERAGEEAARRRDVYHQETNF